jgi:hypothetical protein
MSKIEAGENKRARAAYEKYAAELRKTGDPNPEARARQAVRRAMGHDEKRRKRNKPKDR